MGVDAGENTGEEEEGEEKEEENGERRDGAYEDDDDSAEGDARDGGDRGDACAEAVVVGNTRFRLVVVISMVFPCPFAFAFAPGCGIPFFASPLSSWLSSIGTVIVRTENTARSSSPPGASTLFPSGIAQSSAELSDMFEHASASVAASMLVLLALLLLLLALSRLGVTHPASVVADPFSISSSASRWAAPGEEKDRPRREYSDSHGDEEEEGFPCVRRRRLGGGAVRRAAAAASRRRPWAALRSGVLVTEKGTCMSGVVSGAGVTRREDEARRSDVDDESDGDEEMSAVRWAWRWWLARR